MSFLIPISDSLFICLLDNVRIQLTQASLSVFPQKGLSLQMSAPGTYRNSTQVTQQFKYNNLYVRDGFCPKA